MTQEEMSDACDNLKPKEYTIRFLSTKNRFFEYQTHWIKTKQ
jgi:hypothetical protein